MEKVQFIPFVMSKFVCIRCQSAKCILVLPFDPLNGLVNRRWYMYDLLLFLHVSCCDNVNADCLHIRHLLVCFADIYILSITKHPSVLDIAWCINSHVVFKTNCAYRSTLPWFFKELSTQIKDNGGNRHIN